MRAKDGRQLNRLSALSSLDRLWFALPLEQPLPDVYVVLAARRCNLSCSSGLAEQSDHFLHERFAEYLRRQQP